MDLFIKKYLPEEKKAEFSMFCKANNPMQRLDMLIKKAISIWASDIHIEPSVYEKDDVEKWMLVPLRVRIWGDLKFFDEITWNDVCGIIKMWEDYDVYVRWIKHGLWLGQTDWTIPLDTSHSIKEENSWIDVNLRFSFLPEWIDLPSSIWYFPKIVIRILDNNKNIIWFDDIGLLWHDKTEILKFLNSNQWFLIMAWPTGSWKTTTLYSMIQVINKPGINIQTLEDPIEYRIPWINQSKINAKSMVPYTFALWIRALMRQDPDVILVWETRDTETGKIAIEASTTWHLVFTTLHANSSIEIYSRLIQMGIEKYQVINWVTVGFSQRLIKKVCPHCAKKYLPNDLMKEEFKRMFQWFDFGKLTKEDFLRVFLWKMAENVAETVTTTFKTYRNELDEKEYKLIDDKNNNDYIRAVEIVKKKITDLNGNIYSNLEKVFSKTNLVEANIDPENNCEFCLWEWYKWRNPIFEIIPNTEELWELLLNNASKKELNRYVEKASIFTLKKYAFLALMEWKTDIKEYSNIN